MSFHNFQPSGEETPVSTKVYKITLTDKRECEITIRAESEEAAIKAAWEAVRVDASGWFQSVDSDEDVDVQDDNGQDVDFEV